MKILIVDDNASLARGIKTFLDQEGYECFVSNSVGQAQKILHEHIFDLILTDLKLPDGQGLEVITTAKASKAALQPEVILMTAYGSVESAVEAMKLGASDYLTKPVSMDDLLFRVKKIEEFRRLACVHNNMLRSVGLDGSLDEIAGNSIQIRKVKELVKKVAPYMTTVLITGETGVGKELVARAVHRLSERKDRPFIRVNCASIPENLFEAELFGHEKGAFTDAKTSRTGCFEAGDGGTVFLDEVGEIKPDMQAKLLRVLQEKEITRLGSNKPRKVDVRIVAATNRNLEKMVEEGLFREDLLYRIGVFRIHVPPLRERLQDLEEICLNLIQHLSNELNRGKLSLEKGCVEKLHSYSWPGNIRELKNRLETAAVMSDSNKLEFRYFSFSDRLFNSENSKPILSDDTNVDNKQKFEKLEEAIEELEKKMIIASLNRNANVKSRAAKELGIPRTRLLYRMKKLGINID